MLRNSSQSNGPETKALCYQSGTKRYFQAFVIFDPNLRDPAPPIQSDCAAQFLTFWRAISFPPRPKTTSFRLFALSLENQDSSIRIIPTKMLLHTRPPLSPSAFANVVHDLLSCFLPRPRPSPATTTTSLAAAATSLASSYGVGRQPRSRPRP